MDLKTGVANEINLILTKIRENKKMKELYEIAYGD